MEKIKQLSFLKEEPKKEQKKFFDETLEFIKKMQEESDYLEQIKEEFLYYLDLGLNEEELKNFYVHAHKAFNAFIAGYFEKKDPLYYSQLSNKYQEFVKTYHKVGNLLLFYLNHLHDFETNQLDNNTLDRIETFILKDRIEFQDREALKVFEKLKNKKNYQFFVKMDESDLKKKRVENVKELDFILTNFFVLNYDKKKNPVMFYNGTDENKKYAIEIALEYLSRIYSINHYHKIENDYVIALEKFIVDKNQQDIIMTNSKLCITKSILMARINARNVFGHDTNALKLVLK